MENPNTDSAVIETAAVTELPAADAAIESEMLIEEISIDGMCGVY